MSGHLELKHSEPCATRQREISVGKDPGETLTAIGSAGVVYNRKDEII